MLREGQQLGQYHLHHLLGSGGMGEVYLAEDRRLGRQVAIKVIRSQPLASPESESAKEAQRLFEREARAIARLDHPNILPLYAYGEESIHDDLLIYLVMPYRKEGTLASWLRRRQSSSPLSPAAFAPWLAQAATALEHAHQQGVIHQDVKPTNFLLRLNEEHPDRPDLLLADFGIAKLSHATASSSQSIRGTPTHMAPEQWDGHPLPATDQYALAIMAYEVLVGRPPFQGHPAQVMRQHYQTPPPVPSSLNPELSSAVDAVLLRALSKQSDDRFPSMTAFARAFQDAVHFQGEREERESEPNMQNAPTILPQAQPPQSTIAREEKSMRSVPASEVAAAEMEPIPPTVLAHQPFSAERTTRQPMTSPGKTSALFPREPGHIEGSTTPIQPNTHRRSRRLVLVGLAAVLLVALISANYLFPHAKPLTPGPLPIGTITESTSFGDEIAAGPDGNLWFTKFYLNKIGHLSPSGSATEYAVPTADSEPYGITAGPDGDLWFTERKGDKIGRITPSGTITEFPLPTAKSDPYGIASGPDGNLWFTEADIDKIGRITPSGTITEFPLPTAKSGPGVITVGPDGNLWFTEVSKIGRITPTGTISEFPIPDDWSLPQSITAGPDGNLWFTVLTGGNKIGRITLAGTISGFPIPTAGCEPYGIASGPDGNLWFTEFVGSKIGRITPSGSITEFPTPRSHPTAISTGPNGTLWVIEEGVIGRVTTGK